MSEPAESVSSIKEQTDDLHPTHDQLHELRMQAQAAKKKKSEFAFVFLLCCFAAFAGFINGYDSASVSGLLNMPDFLERFGQLNAQGVYYFSKVRSGLIVGSFAIGGGIGSLTIPKTGDMWGRKPGIYTATLVYIVGVLIEVCSFDKWYQFFIGRVFGGAGVGAMCVLVPMFMAEVAPEEIRGMVVSSFQLFITFGIFLAYLVAYGTNARPDTGAWRIPMGLCFAWAVLLVVGVSFMPESPRLLIQKGKFEEARAAMCRVGKREANDPVIRLNMDEITAAVEHEREVGTAGWGELFTGKPRLGFRLFIGAGIQILQQLAGANYFFYYGTSIFKAIGMDDSYQTSIVFGVVNFASTFVALYVVDRFGRRNCLLIGAVAMFVFFIIYASLGTAALYPNGEDKPSDSSVGKGMIAVTCFFIFSFAITWGPIAFVITSEVFPLRVKSKGMGISLLLQWVGNFLLSFFTPFITGAIGFKYGYVFAGCLFLCFAFVFFCVPETKGLTLEQIDQYFASGIPAWRSYGFKPEDYSQPNSDFEKGNAAHA